MRGSCPGCSAAGTLRRRRPEMRSGKTGSMSSETPSSCTSQLAWPIQVMRAGSPTAGGRERSFTSARTCGTSARPGLRRLRPVILSITAQRKIAPPGLGPEPSMLVKRGIRESLLQLPFAQLRFGLRNLLSRLRQPLLLVDQIEADAEDGRDDRHQDGG